MKQVLALIAMLLFSTISFANASPSASSSTTKLNALSKAWKSYRNIQPGATKNDIEMVYGGEDVKRPTVMQVAQA